MLERGGETLAAGLLQRQQNPSHGVEVVFGAGGGEGLAGETLGLEPGASPERGFGLLHGLLNVVAAGLGHCGHHARTRRTEQADPTTQRWSGSTSMNRIRASAATRSATRARARTLPVRVVPRSASTSSTT